MFAGFQRGDGLPGMIGNGRVDMHCVHLRIFDELIEIGVALLHTECVANGIQLLFGALANGIHRGVGVALIDGNEFSAESETDDGHLNLSSTHLFVGCAE